MTNRPLAFCLTALIALMSVSGCTAASKVDLRRLVTSGRDGYQQPERVIEALTIKPGNRVAEIGAGDGYWIPWLSRAVGESGTVYAVEVEEEKADSLKRLVAEKGFTNVEVVLGRYEDPLLPDAKIDIAMTSKTYHHIEDRVPYFERLKADLAPHGRVVHLDDRHDLPFPISLLTRGHNSDPAAIDAEMTEAGYRQTQSFDFIYTQSFLVYVPAGSKAD